MSTFPVYENMANSTYRVEHSQARTLTYGANTYHVVDNTGFVVYEVGSKAKAAAVAEYLKLVAEQANIDQYRTPDIRGSFIPRSVK